MVVLLLVGAGLCVLGVVLTLTIVGAVVGIPLVFAGLGVLVMAFILPLGRGSVRFQNIRLGRGRHE